MYYVGIDLGGTSFKIGIVDQNNNLTNTIQWDTMKEQGFEQVVQNIAQKVLAFIESRNLTISEIENIGIGAPGVIDPRDKTIYDANNLGWHKVDLIKELKKYIDKDIYLSNDANCALLGEHLAGAARHYKNVVMLTLGTGIGGGMIWNGKLSNGGNGINHEPGHFIIKFDGKQCNCGKRGCLEAYASQTALLNDAEILLKSGVNSILKEEIEGDFTKLNVKMIFDAEKKGDHVAIKLIDDFVNYLSIGIGNIIDLLRPEAIILGGGISRQGDYLIDKIKLKTNKFVYGYGELPETEILAAELGNDAGIIGAALLCKCK